MKPFYRTCLTLALLIASAAASALEVAERKPGLWLNQVPAVIDTTAANIYFSLPKDAPDNITGTLRWDDTMYRSVTLDDTQLTADTLNFSIRNWTERGAHKLTLRNVAGEDSHWTLVFTNLPIINVEQNQKWLYDQDKKYSYKGPYFYGTITVIDPNLRTRYKDNDEEGILNRPIVAFTCPLKIKVRGATSKGLPKKSFNIKLVDENNEAIDIHLLGYRKDNAWMLGAACYDMARFRNRMLTDLWNLEQDLPYDKDNDYQGNGISGEFVELFMEGKYWGIYEFSDRIDRKKLNLKKTAEAEGDQPERTRGMMWKTLMQAGECSLAKWDQDPRPNSFDWALDYKNRPCMEQKYPDDRPDQADFRPICNIIDNATGNDVSDQQLMDSLESFVYVDQWIDYIILTQAFQIQDNMCKNYFLSIRNIEKGRLFNLTPWDMDASIGRAVNATEQQGDKWWAFGEQLLQGNNICYRLGKSKKVTKWRQQLYDRWCDLYFSTWSLDSVNTRIDTYANLFHRSGAWAREFAKWSPELNSMKIKEIKEGDIVVGYDTTYTRHIADDILAEAQYMKDFLVKNYRKFNDKMVSFGFPDPESLVGVQDVAFDGRNSFAVLDGDRLFVATTPGAQCRLFSLSGQLVTQTAADKRGNAVFNLSGKPHGVYCVTAAGQSRKIAY